MDPNCNSEPPPRQKIPLDGAGPRGLPECYYTSRVRNSTFRYVRFINKLRAHETEQRIGTENLVRETKHKQCNEFFARSDRRNLINKVTYRVNLCLQAYEEDLQRKKEKLKDLLTSEEELNMRKFVAQVQEGPELIWQAKKERLAYLLNKRRLEHEAKHSAPPLSKATHLLPCLINIRTRESKEFQRYQMREKQMRREAEKEMDKMWYEVAMKEAEALAARMEYDEIERARRQRDCNAYNALQLEQKRIQRAKEREKLKEEMRQMNLALEEEHKKLAEEEHDLQEATAKTRQAKEEMLKERLEAVAKKNAEEKIVNDLWDDLTATVGKDDAKLEEELRRRRKSDVVECNRKMAELKHNIAKVKENNEQLIQQEGDRLRDAADLKRCQRKKLSERTKAADAAANYQTYLDKQASTKEDLEELEYERQVNAQISELVKQKEMTEAQARKLYQNDLREQIAYNKLLRERARQEELDQIRKSEIATKEYYEEMKEMLRRPYYSDAVHPFMQQMISGPQQIKKCPCALPNYCADPKPDPDRNQK